MKLDHWPLSKIERELPWSPFPLELGKFALDECVEGEERLEQFLSSDTIDDHERFETLTWKEEGLRILDDTDEEDEEEIEVLVDSDPDEFQSLVRKRKRELEDDCRIDEAEGGNISENTTNVTASQKPPFISALTLLERQQPGTKNGQSGKSLTPSPSGAFSTIFSVSEQLNYFRSIQSGCIPKTGFVNLELESAKEKVQVQTGSEDAQNSKPDQLEHPCNSHSHTAEKQEVPLPHPGTLELHAARPIVICAAFMISRRQLVRAITELYPAGELIERDFSPRYDIEPPFPDQKAYIDQEADLAISPATGIICTTMQKIRQKPLPGQTRLSPIRERIASVSKRYEKLFVLVGQSNHALELDERDSEALFELKTFVKPLQSEVVVSYMPGGDQHMARWVIGLLSNENPLGEGVNLSQDETLWEIFLRRAGLNSFAAQAILSELKAPEYFEDGSCASKFGTHGLAAFINMSAEERIQRFGVMLGGVSVLQRVSELVDVGGSVVTG